MMIIIGWSLQGSLSIKIPCSNPRRRINRLINLHGRNILSVSLWSSPLLGDQADTKKNMAYRQDLKLDS